MKVLAKLGLVTAAAATVLFIFIYEFQGPLINKVMSQPPPPGKTEEPQEINQGLTNTTVDIELPDQEEMINTQPEETNDDPEENAQPEEINTLEEITAQPEEATAEPEEIETSPEEEATVVVEEAEEIEEVTGPTRRIYGKITLSTSGEQLGGVNIMVPGSTVAKISNANGGYTIEVPVNTRELVFIYRGKKLSQPINSGSLMNVVLNLETMQYD